MKIRRMCLTCALSLSIVFYPQRSSAFDIVLDPSNLVQAIIQAARLLQSNINEAAMIANQIKQLENDFKNLLDLPFDIIDEFRGQFESLYQTLGSIEGLMQHLAELEAKFEEAYPDLSAEINPVSSYTMAADMHSRLLRTRDMIKGSLKTSAQVLENMPANQGQLAALMESSQAAEGILQAAQAGNQIAGDIAGQLINLNAQLGSYIQAHTAQLMQQNGAALAAKNRLDHVMDDWLLPEPSAPFDQSGPLDQGNVFDQPTPLFPGGL